MAINKIDGNDHAASMAAAKAKPLNLRLVAASEAEFQLPDKSELAAAAQRLNELISPNHTSVEFILDEATSIPVIKVIDSETKSVIRQLPNEEALVFSRNLDKFNGLIFRQKV